MIRKIALAGFLLLAVLPLAADNTANYILVVYPRYSGSDVAAQYGLTITDFPAPNIFKVSAPSTVGSSQLIQQVAADSRVQDFELDGIAHHPEMSAANLNQSTAGILDQLPSVSVVSYFGNQVPSYYVNQTATSLIRLADAQTTKGATGAGIVAVIDTGVDPNHAALKGALLPGYDLTRNQAGASEWLDLNQSTAGILDQSTAGILDMNRVTVLNQSTAAILDQSTAGILDPTTIPQCFGHGTMVAGIVHLVAPTATILPLKAFYSDCTAPVSRIIRAIHYAVNNGASVINLSADIGPNSDPALRAAVDFATDKGVVVVASAGNSGAQLTVYPAGYSDALGVASTNLQDQQSTFTNYGSVASMAAPGEAIQTTYPGNFYAAAWGTSFSTPFVSGTVALLQQFDATLNYTAAAAAFSAPGDCVFINPNLGWGRLDVYGAVSYFH